MAASRARMAARSPLFLRDAELTRGMQLVFLAVRDLLAGGDAVLQGRGLARIHHGVLHFVAHRQGLTVAELQALLGVSKQSLSRALKHLMGRGLLVQTPGRRDRRQRVLALTEAGSRLALELDEVLRARLASAFREAGIEAVAGFERVLHGLLDDDGRRQLEALP